jgi:hypothetical protein
VLAFLSALAVLFGSLHGTVMRGPIKPVCQEGVSCDGPAANVTLIFTRAGTSTSTSTDEQGHYRLKLKPGLYAVRTNQRVFGRTPNPSSARVIAGRDRVVNFFIDTGIR